MVSRAVKMMSMVLQTNCQKNDRQTLELLNIPAYESTKGLTKEEMEIAIGSKDVFYNKYEEIANLGSFNQGNNFVVTPHRLVNYSCSEASSEEEEQVTSSNFHPHDGNVSTKDTYSPASQDSSTTDHLTGDSESESNFKIIEKTTNEKIIVPKTNNTKHIRVWDKKAACLFCSKLCSKLPEHLQLVHSEEKEVSEFLSKCKGSQERRILISQLRKKGNFLHNKSVNEKQKGEMLTCRRPNSSCNPEEYLPCEYCLGFYKITKLSRHVRRCNQINKKHKRTSSIVSSAIFFSTPNIASEQLKAILNNMTNDEVSLVVRNDDLIMKYGSLLCDKFDGQNHLASYISQKLRELARFVISARRYENNMTLRRLINPENFNTVIKCVREVAGLDNTGEDSARPSLALKIGYSLKKCCRIIKAEAIRKGNELNKKKIDDFLELYELDWSNKILMRATKMLDKAKWNKPSLLPIAEDIKKFNIFIQEREEELYNMLKNGSDKEEDFKEMVAITLAHVITFNRKRVGDVERIEMKSYLQRPQHLPQGEIEKSLTNCEKLLTKRMTLFTIRGKHDRGVPLLLTPTMVRNIDLLIVKREFFSVPPTNKFLFPRTKCESHIRGTDALRTVSQNCRANCPNHLTSTSLRKHIATVSQILNLSNNELEHLAKHLGHSINVHRDYYRLPDTTIQLAKVSKLLLKFEKGELEKGTTLDDIDLDLDEELTEFKSHKKEESKQDVLQENTDQSFSDSDCEIKKTKRQHKKVKVTGRMPRVTARVAWTKSQSAAVEKYFKKEIVRELVPGKNKCLQCIEKYECLKPKSWITVKSKVHNIIQRNKKRQAKK